MEKTFADQLEALLEKYSELLVGEADEETKEKVKAWALYSHIAKSMPALINHWSTLYPEARAEMKEIINEIKVLNEQHRKSMKK
ncbi:YusU family protein [Neobacillus niacini]|uniref:YusU family protein n=1 Tax=Neobacillus niacini TaxID=86668 RepID=UPI0021CB35A5|nr:YusU family protein [Neobacillus niacini]MCM3765846.1 YusU family protein [Neobacillus niacini]